MLDVFGLLVMVVALGIVFILLDDGLPGLAKHFGAAVKSFRDAAGLNKPKN